MAKDKDKFDPEALARIGRAMTEAYETKGQPMLEDHMESKYLQQQEGGILSDFLRTLSKDPRGWRGERSPREYESASETDAHFGGQREQFEATQSREFDASISRMQSARDEQEAKQLDRLYKEQERERKKQEKLYKKQLKEQEQIAKAQAREDERERKAEGVRQFGESARGRSPLALEDFDDMSQFQKARRMRDRYIEERAGDYLGAPADSFLGYHGRMELEKDDIESELEAKEKERKRIADINYGIAGDAYLDQPGGYVSKAAKAKYMRQGDPRYKAIEDAKEKERKRIADINYGIAGDAYLDQPGGYLSKAGRAKYEKEGDSYARSEFNSLRNQYSRLGTEIRKETNPLKKTMLVDQRNALIDHGKKYAASLGIREKDMVGQYPFVDKASSLDKHMDTVTGAFKGKDRVSRVGSEVFGQAGQGSFYKRGQLFRGTSYASTGAINGVMRALAGIFILFVFIGVFYMVFGPIYDSLIFNFINIVSADGDPTLGGKDIPTLFDNVAKVVLVWVPLIVFAGALYKLTALVFEREVGTRTTEETEWDALLSGEDSMDLDMGSGPEPGVFDAYGGGW